MRVRNRVYLAELGRWSRRDPIGYRGGLNLFSYVLNQPISDVDPFGLINWQRIDPSDLPPWGEKGMCYICYDDGGHYCAWFVCDSDTAGGPGPSPPGPGAGGPPGPPAPPPPPPPPCDAFFPGGAPGIPPAPGASCNVWANCRFAPGTSPNLQNPKCAALARDAARQACNDGHTFQAAVNIGLREAASCRWDLWNQQQCWPCINSCVAITDSCAPLRNLCQMLARPGTPIIACLSFAPGGLPIPAYCLLAGLAGGITACLSWQICIEQEIRHCAAGCGC